MPDEVFYDDSFSSMDVSYFIPFHYLTLCPTWHCVLSHEPHSIGLVSSLRQENIPGEGERWARLSPSWDSCRKPEGLRALIWDSFPWQIQTLFLLIKIPGFFFFFNAIKCHLSKPCWSLFITPLSLAAEPFCMLFPLLGMLFPDSLVS